MMLLVLALVVLVLEASSLKPDVSETSCDFETTCAWNWSTEIPHGFRRVTGQEAGVPSNDANNDTLGKSGQHFILTAQRACSNCRDPRYTSPLSWFNVPNVFLVPEYVGTFYFIKLDNLCGYICESAFCNYRK